MSYILLKEVSFTYPGRKEPAVKNITIEVKKGEKIAITGLNGSGKSTLSKLILGLLKPQKGRILLDGKDIKNYSLAEIGRKLGYVLQNPNQMLFNTTVYDEVAFGLKWKGMGRDHVHHICKKYLSYFELWHLRNEMPFNLSEGQKQLVILSAILAMQPDYLILDEPTKSVDGYRRKKLQSILLDTWEKGTGIIVISHDKDFVAGFNGRRIQMAKGEVVTDEVRYQN